MPFALKVCNVVQIVLHLTKYSSKKNCALSSWFWLPDTILAGVCVCVRYKELDVIYQTFCDVLVSPCLLLGVSWPGPHRDWLQSLGLGVQFPTVHLCIDPYYNLYLAEQYPVDQKKDKYSILHFSLPFELFCKWPTNNLLYICKIFYPAFLLEKIQGVLHN